MASKNNCISWPEGKKEQLGCGVTCDCPRVRNKLQNYDIDFVIEMNSIELDTTPYTNSEKFKAMTAKNANLQTLRDVLGLDIN